MNEPSRCVCCGLTVGLDSGDCGHLFCYICLGRGHDEDCVECEKLLHEAGQ